MSLQRLFNYSALLNENRVNHDKINYFSPNTNSTARNFSLKRLILNFIAIDFTINKLFLINSELVFLI